MRETNKLLFCIIEAKASCRDLKVEDSHELYREENMIEFYVTSPLVTLQSTYISEWLVM